MNTRTGKIARLPKQIREQLNRRLENGHTARTILTWLNALPETKQILAEQFESKPIRAQNLSEWKKGGYRDWLQQQQRIDWFDHFCENETELAKHENCGDTFEAMSRIFIVEIGQSIAALRNLKNPQERCHCLQNLVREFSRLQNAFNFSRRTQLDFDKHNGPAKPEPPIEEEDDDEDTQESEAPEPVAPPPSAFCILPSALNVKPKTEDLPLAEDPEPPTEKSDQIPPTPPPPPVVPQHEPQYHHQPAPPKPPVQKYSVHSIPIRRRRFHCLEG